MTIAPFAGYFALFAWIFLAEAGVPLLVPTELLLISAGVAASPDLAALATVAVVSLVADLVGTAVLFGLVRLFARRPERAPAWIVRSTAWATAKARVIGAGTLWRYAVARSIPFFRIPAAGAAGLVGLPTVRYLAAALAGGIVWVAVFAGGAFCVADGLFPSG